MRARVRGQRQRLVSRLRAVGAGGLPPSPRGPIKKPPAGGPRVPGGSRRGGKSRRARARGGGRDRPGAVAFPGGEPPPGPRRVAGGAGPGPFTRRERDVAALVARGQSNGQIAASLVISVRT